MMTLEEALSVAQRFADEKNVTHAVYEHVGLYGDPTGDIPARHSFKIVDCKRPEPDNQWAMVAIARPTDCELS